MAAFAVVYITDDPVGANVNDVATQFSFSHYALPEVPGPPLRSFRQTHPELRHITAFMSTVGASAALNDLDGDGLPNDVCYVETRTDQVIVAPAPGSGQRYQPFALDPNMHRALFDRDKAAPLGCLPGDIDEDGRIDLIVYYAGRTPILFLSRPTEDNGTLSVRNFLPVDIIPGTQDWVTGSATLADLDGDGHLELIVANYFADGSAIYDPHARSPVYMPESFSRAFNGGGLRIYRCLPKIEGTELTVGCSEVLDALPPGSPKGWGLALAAYDIDGDLLPELYVANDFGPDRFFWNRSTPGRIRFELVEGQTSLEKPKSRVVGRDSFKTMGVDFADLNGDGIPDFFVSNVTDPWAIQEGQLLFLSTGSLALLAKRVAPYVEAAEAWGLARSGWAWEAKLDDFNNDGILEALQATGFIKGQVSRWPELHELATANDGLIGFANISWPSLMPGDDVSGSDRNAFFVQRGKRYINISAKIGFGEDHVSRGIAIADVDGDGKLDMVVANMWGPSSYYHNECKECENFLGLHLRLPTIANAEQGTLVRPGHPGKSMPPGRPAIGAAVTVTTASGRQLSRQVDGGNGHSGRRSPDLHFGLGADDSAVRVDIKWRNAAGHPQQETHYLNPGWYSLLLGTVPQPP